MILTPQKSGLAASVIIFSVVVLCAVPSCAQNHPSDTNSGRDLEQLVRAVMHNEIETQHTDTSLWCFHQQHQEDDKPAKALDVCQTRLGELERTVAINGQELNVEQQRAEDQRLQRLLRRPERLKAKQKKEREDGEQTENLLKVFPDAFRFQCEGESGPFVKLNFRPNPNFRAGSRAAMVFHHMEGTLVVDERQKRIAEIDGQITSEVKFGGGLLGHLDRGGTFHIKQEEVGSGHWEMTMMNVRMSGKVLFFKSLSVLEKNSYSGFRPLPSGASLEQAVAFLTNDANVSTASAKASSGSR